MYAYVDELHPHQTHFSIPFILVVWIYLCVCAFFKCHFEPFWPVRNGLRRRIRVWLIDHPAIYSPSIHPPTPHLLASGDPYHYLKLL